MVRLALSTFLPRVRGHGAARAAIRADFRHPHERQCRLVVRSVYARVGGGSKPPFRPFHHRSPTQKLQVGSCRMTCGASNGNLAMWLIPPDGMGGLSFC